jgi:amino acid transporter
LIYLLVNAAFLWGLGFEGLRASRAPASDVLRMMLGDTGAHAMSLLVMVSALGAINGLIFTGSRVYYALGADHAVFAWLGRWHPRWPSPVYSMIAQALVATLLISAVGTRGGRNTFDAAMQHVGLNALPWNQYGGGFDTLVAGTAPVFWLFFLLTGLSLFTLREKDRDIPRPFSVPCYPFVPFLFCLMCLYMLYSSITYARELSLLGVAPLVLGLPLYLFSRSVKQNREKSTIKTEAKK